MGSYAEVIGVDGTRYQFYPGDAFYETYRIGETVRWNIWPDRPGEGTLLDDVYEGYGDHNDAHVVIKDHRIALVLPFAKAEDDFFRRRDAQHAMLVERYAITPPPREWWTEAAWAAKETRDAKRKAELEAEHTRNACRRKHKHTLDCILKQFYSPKSLKKLLYTESPILAMLPKRGTPVRG